jgi:hypothetical protein
MGIPLLDSGARLLRGQIEMNCGVEPHYKLEKINSNFVLKFLFNALAQKIRAERVSLKDKKVEAKQGAKRPVRNARPCGAGHPDALGALLHRCLADYLELIGSRQADNVT